MHGQSEYTPTKQAQLKSLLEACYLTWSRSHWFASPGRYFMDCMAGSGHDEEGNEGSPLILQNYAKRIDQDVNFAGTSQCVWCDKDQKFTNRLEGYKDDRYTTLLTGRYQTEVTNYLNDVPKNAMGLVYLDDNGCKEVWNDDGFLRRVMASYSVLDIAIHFSETSWKRSSANHFDWATDKNVMDMLRMVLHYKPASVIFAPRGPNPHHWRLVYGCASGKMNLTGQSRMKLREYIDARPENQMSLLDMEGMK